MEAQDIVDQAFKKIMEITKEDEAFRLGLEWSEEQIAAMGRLPLRINRIGAVGSPEPPTGPLWLTGPAGSVAATVIPVTDARTCVTEPTDLALPRNLSANTVTVFAQDGSSVVLPPVVAPHDPVCAEPEIPVTEEMIAAAHAVPDDSSPLRLTAIYRAMAALEPNPPNWQRERNNLLKMAVSQVKRINALEAANRTLKQRVDFKEARIAELKSELAAFTAANAPPKSEPKRNPFRDFLTDPRRIGR